MDGLEICRTLRRESAALILMLTARDGELERVVGFETSSDDYVTKPLSPRELVARVRAILRRATAAGGAEGGGQSAVTVGALRLEPDKREVTLGGNSIELTAKEVDLLKRMMSHPDRVFTRESLLENIWGYDYFGSTRTVDMFISRLRERIEDDPGSPTFIVTVRGVGYKFRWAAEAAQRKSKRMAR